MSEAILRKIWSTVKLARKVLWHNVHTGFNHCNWVAMYVRPVSAGGGRCQVDIWIWMFSQYGFPKGAKLPPVFFKRSLLTSRSHLLKNLSMISPLLLFLLFVTQAYTFILTLKGANDNATLGTVTNKSKVLYFHLKTFVTEFIQEF